MSGQITLKCVSRRRRICHGFEQFYFIAEGYELLLNEVHPGAVLGSHAHDFAQLGYCFEGSFTFKAAEAEYLIGQDDSYLLPGQVVHSAEILDRILTLDFKYPGSPVGQGLLLDVIGSTKRRFSAGRFRLHRVAEGSGAAAQVLRPGSGTDALLFAVKPQGVRLNGSSFALEPMQIYQLEGDGDIAISSDGPEQSSEFMVLLVAAQQALPAPG